MIALIIIGICIASLIIHLTIGHLTALRLAPKVAELSMRPTNGTGKIEYEWENSYQSSSKRYEIRWLTDNWRPKSVLGEEWQKTGRTRKQGNSDDFNFDQDFFKGRMALIRQLWFIGVPLTISNVVDTKMIEKYDPSVAERKAKQQDARIAELEKELEIDA